jgi:BASS family bile acid:Na+ symporter
MAEFLIVLGQLAALVFVVCQMISMGLVLTVQEILSPLKDTRLIILALVANFVIVPLVALALVSLFSLSEGYAIGLIILGCAAGAPFLPKLTQITKGDIAFSVGLMVLTMLLTIIFLPLLLPLLIKGVTVDPWDIAKSLIVLMLIPLGIALLIRARYAKIAERLAPYFSKVTSIAMIVLMFSIFVAYLPELAGAIGSMAIIAAIIFILAAFGAGFFLGGPDREKKKVLGMGTALRNFAAAIAVAALNFTNPEILVMVLVVILVSLVVLILIGKWLGKSSSERIPLATLVHAVMLGGPQKRYQTKN